MGDINAMTFFTCASGGDMLGRSSAPRVSLSPEGCALIFSRMRRRLDAVGLSIADVLALFTSPGDTDVTAEQWLEVASSLPLGISRAEMQQLYSKVDAAGADRIPISEVARLMASASAAHCATAPTWISTAMQRGLVHQIRDELHKLGGVNGATLARESDFKRVVMQTERYLTSDQLSSLLLLADKNSLGLIDYQDFFERFASGGAVRVPGGVLPSATPAWSAASGASASDEELRAIGSRTAAVMERQGFAPERLPALLGLWGGSAPPDTVARLLAMLPLGLSHQEASSLIQAAGGDVNTLVLQLCEYRNQGMWRSWCEWAASNIPGPTLRAVLQQQVIEAECRTLDPAEFVRNLTDAGVKAPSTTPALWLAEKTEQGDICVAEFLTNFGGAAASAADEQKKKKRGMRYRFWGR
jgi:Ca2+-binding EF-hand superfamily protein